MKKSQSIKDEDIDRLKKEIDSAEAIIIGGGAGFSTSAGYYYSGERFFKYFFDFNKKYSINDMYSGAFHKFSDEEFWSYFSRLIYVNRYTKIPLPAYDNLYTLVKDKNYFVITTNCDHCFQKAHFSKEKLFYTQGDYGCLQCKKPCKQKVYDNKDIIIKLLLNQGFKIGDDGELIVEDKGKIKMKVDKNLIPKCPDCGGKMNYHLRGDDTFVEDEGWHKASERYHEFLDKNKNKKVLFMELGIGFNTPGIIKYPFMKYVHTWPNAVYCCINYGEAFAPDEIAKKSILFNNDINEVLVKLLEKSK